ncbi:hypothetical protein VTN00DRAFT_916 [Thermoascus crustaceus]|uniref:uncharacterized protein n=1 Tax=Thermoascus crustaceus TaxID=5088 RepID=UPI0037443A8B
MVKEIPGFYYDPEKKKYFKIQANHVAPPGYQYSEGAIKEKKLEEKRRKHKSHHSRRIATERIRRAITLEHPLIGVQRELGWQRASSRDTFEKQGKAYASNLRRKELHRYSPWGTSGDNTITHILRNRSGLMVVEFAFQNSIATRGRTTDHWSESCTNFSIGAALDSGPGGDPFLLLRAVPDPVEEETYRWSTLASVRHPTRVQEETTLWSSSPRPTGDTPFFAIGTSQGLHTLEGVGYRWNLEKKQLPPNAISGKPAPFRYKESSHSTVMSVEWLTSDVIVSGLLDSSIFFHDIRSGGTVTRLQHPHAASKIRKIDPYRLVVAGHKSLQMYDIRYPANGLQSRPKPGSPDHTSTKPYVSFPEYSHSTRFNVYNDFDVSPELGLLAGVTDDSKLRLFSLLDGTVVNSPASSYQHDRSISCVRFESGEWPVLGSHVPRLLLGTGPVVEEWTW